MELNSDWDVKILSELPDSDFDFPPFEFEDEDEEEGECTSSSEEEEDFGGNDICLDEALFPNLITQLASSSVKRSNSPPVSAVYCLTLGLADKDPISALYELCAKLKLNPPKFELVHKVGAKNSVTVNDKVYCPALANSKFKDAKRAAAKLCLEELGILPKH
ncbi:hypothetical protein C0J52_03194 [Blattella germanica]|nr:hypothetical protein C0J52_03194 [Blattella germanica]